MYQISWSLESAILGAKNFLITLKFDRQLHIAAKPAVNFRMTGSFYTHIL